MNYAGEGTLTPAIAEHFHNAWLTFTKDPTMEDRIVMQAPNMPDGNINAWMSVELDDKMKFRAELKGIDTVFIKLWTTDGVEHCLVMPSDAAPDEEGDGPIEEDTTGGFE
jgi:hypothetical protein